MAAATGCLIPASGTTMPAEPDQVSHYRGLSSPSVKPFCLLSLSFSVLLTPLFTCLSINLVAFSAYLHFSALSRRAMVAALTECGSANAMHRTKGGQLTPPPWQGAVQSRHRQPQSSRGKALRHSKKSQPGPLFHTFVTPVQFMQSC